MASAPARRSACRRRAGIVIATWLLPWAAMGATPEAPRAWYPVWSAVLTHGLEGQPGSVLIVNETVSAPWASVDVNADRRGGTDRAPFLAAARPPADATAFAIDDRLMLDRAYVLMDRKSLDTLFDVGPVDGWHIFFARFPDVPGIVGLSAVRFTGDREEAAVYLSFGCGADCGTGRVVYLKRGEGLDWQIAGSELLWIASGEKTQAPARGAPKDRPEQ